MEKEPHWVSVPEARRILSCSEGAIYHWIEKGWIRSMQDPTSTRLFVAKEDLPDGRTISGDFRWTHGQRKTGAKKIKRTYTTEIEKTEDAQRVVETRSAQPMTVQQQAPQQPWYFTEWNALVDQQNAFVNNALGIIRKLAIENDDIRTKLSSSRSEDQKTIQNLLADNEDLVKTLEKKYKRIDDLTKEADDWSELCSAAEAETAKAHEMAERFQRDAELLREQLTVAEELLLEAAHLKPEMTAVSDRGIYPYRACQNESQQLNGVQTAAKLVALNAQKPSADEEVPIGSKWQSTNGAHAVVDRFTANGKVVLKVGGANGRPWNLPVDQLLTSWKRI